MHFLLLLLRFVLDRLIPTWRDGLTMAVRADGRIEHIPPRPSLWEHWLSLLRHDVPRQGRGRGKVRAGCGAREGKASSGDPAGGR